MLLGGHDRSTRVDPFFIKIRSTCSAKVMFALEEPIRSSAQCGNMSEREGGFRRTHPELPDLTPSWDVLSPDSENPPKIDFCFLGFAIWVSEIREGIGGLEIWARRSGRPRLRIMASEGNQRFEFVESSRGSTKHSFISIRVVDAPRREIGIIRRGNQWYEILVLLS